MKTVSLSLIVGLNFLLIPDIHGFYDLSVNRSSVASSILTESASGPLFAQKSGSSRKRRISAEGQVRKTGDKTTIDFDSISISGERKTPLGSMINQNRADKEYDFVKIRLRWHPEMKKSASSLDTSR